MSTASASKTLLIDVGNTRVKWAVRRGITLGGQQAFAHDGESRAELARFIGALPKGIEAVRMVSVVHDGFADRLAAAVRKATGVKPERIESARAAVGVRCGYREPWRLGADRWVAVIGAHHFFETARDACVVDVGTAMTIDLVDRNGRHYGGAIVPGPDVMVSSLLSGTSGIARRAVKKPPPGRELFARDTAAALAQGARHADAALIERACDLARHKLGRRPVLFLTGGAAPQLLPYLKRPLRHVPDLVLRGLAAFG